MHSKTLQKIVDKNPLKYAEYYFESGHGHWIHLTPAYLRSGYGDRTFRTETVKEMIELLSWQVVGSDTEQEK